MQALPLGTSPLDAVLCDPTRIHIPELGGCPLTPALQAVRPPAWGWRPPQGMRSAGTLTCFPAASPPRPAAQQNWPFSGLPSDPLSADQVPTTLSRAPGYLRGAALAGPQPGRCAGPDAAGARPGGSTEGGASSLPPRSSALVSDSSACGSLERYREVRRSLGNPRGNQPKGSGGTPAGGGLLLLHVPCWA